MHRRLHRNVVYLGCLIELSHMRPNAGGGGSCGVSANEYSCTQEPKNSLFNLFMHLLLQYASLRRQSHHFGHLADPTQDEDEEEGQYTKNANYFFNPNRDILN
jgi:hypothetical protein